MAAKKDINKKRKKQVAMLIKVRKKIGIAFFLVGIMLAILAAKICIINYKNGDKYSKAVLDHQQYTTTTLPYKRGEIIDCNGTILAYSEKVYNLILDPKLILSDSEYKEPTMNALTQCFHLQRSDLESIISSKPNSQYEKMLKNLTSDEIASFQAIIDDNTNNPNVKGVWFEESYTRKYPFSTLASDAIGFANNENGGELGLENYYNNDLSGIDGITYGYVDEDLNIEQTTKKPVDGYNIVTTLDFSVQSIIEKRIKTFNETYGSASTAVIIMDPNNGDILGMASYPTFDLNNPRDLTGVYTQEQISAMTDEEKTTNLYSLWKNYCVSNIYEPGSTFKPFTVSAAFEEGYLNGSETYNCTGSEEIGGYTIHCHVRTGHGTITLEQSIMQSCNVAMMEIGAKMGAKTFAEYQDRFGFGQKTSIDLPGEEAGITIAGDKMSVTDVATNSFGQNISVNMVQMTSAFSSLINGGNYYQPHLVKRIETSSGEVVSSSKSTLVKQTVTQATSDTLKQYLKSTVDEGLAKKAKVTGYSIAGKTGTAQKLPREDNKYIISFLGYAPAENPKFVIYVIIDEPDLSAGPNGTSSPVLILTHDILSDLLPYMNVYKDSEEEAVDTSTAAVESYQVAPLTGTTSATTSATTSTTSATTSAR